MGMHSAPASERVHIGFFGERNAGKSSILNAVAGQEMAIVSPLPGTTTDPVYKTMEILPLGPVMLIDTAGIDDCGEIGDLRVRKTRQVLNKTDIAVLVIASERGITDFDRKMYLSFEQRKIPYVIAFNKTDLCPGLKISAPADAPSAKVIAVSALLKAHIDELKNLLAGLSVAGNDRKIVADLISPKDTVVLVTPIDSAAPKGRLILPQQQVAREILETGAIAMITREFELSDTLAKLKSPPSLVITDSQAFTKVSADTPIEIPLTSFSILFARYKGDLAEAVRGAKTVGQIRDGGKILISEGCTHHRQCDDIGTVKLPRWIRSHTQKEFEFSFTSGGEFPDDLSPFQLIVHCGGCMLNAKEMRYRVACAKEQKIPLTNYGVLIAYMQGILPRCVAMFPEVAGEI